MKMYNKNAGNSMDFEDFFKIMENEYYCIHCKTEKEAMAFCNNMSAAGRMWASGDSYSDDTNFIVCEEDTVYYPNKDMFGNLHRVKPTCKIFEFDDIFGGFEYEYKDLPDSSKLNARENLCESFGIVEDQIEPSYFENVQFDRNGEIV